MALHSLIQHEVAQSDFTRSAYDDIRSDIITTVQVRFELTNRLGLLGQSFFNLVCRAVANANIQHSLFVMFRVLLSLTQRVSDIFGQQTEIAQYAYSDLLFLKEAIVSGEPCELIFAKIH